MICTKIIPNSLLFLKNPPSKLYMQGREELLNMPKVAIVGSRRMSTYTKNCVSNLAFNLKKHGVVVVSGGAIGVDACAHESSYPNTIAIMPTSLDIKYPKANEKLLKNMSKNSLLISEYEPTTYARKYNFVLRNRIVVALSDAVVIAQADLNSGSMRSALYAIELKKPLFVLPHRIDESLGTNELVAKNQALIINDFDFFCKKFGNGVVDEHEDELLSFCKNNPFLEDCLKQYGSIIYEYELDGKIVIDGLTIRVIS